jgi:hypothetical protein
MFSADTSLTFGHFFEDLLVVPLHVVVFSYNVDVDVAIADVAVAKNKLARFSQMIGQSGPFFNVKADVISKNLALISGKHCNIFSHFPNLLEFNVIA